VQFHADEHLWVMCTDLNVFVIKDTEDDSHDAAETEVPVLPRVKFLSKSKEHGLLDEGREEPSGEDEHWHKDLVLLGTGHHLLFFLLKSDFSVIF